MSKKAELEELQKKYDRLLEEYEELRRNVTCDYYEAYLLEKKKNEKYQSVVKEKEVYNVAGWEYYNA